MVGCYDLSPASFLAAANIRCGSHGAGAAGASRALGALDWFVPSAPGLALMIKLFCPAA